MDLRIKAADQRDGDIEVLTRLLGRPGLDGPRRREIEREIATIKAGIAGERDAAYQIELYFGQSSNWMTIHDLRVEVGEYSAQIDHLILNRLGEIWVCESKHFAEGVSVNDHGEWTRWWNGRPQGIPSPVEQNRRHMHLLARLFDEGLVPLPKRLGLLAMRPDLRSLVLVSNNARIGRPRRSIPELEDVIKVEKLRTKLFDEFDKTPPHRMGRMMGKEGLESFARNLAALHKPMSVNWPVRFGLPTVVPARNPAPVSAAPVGSVWSAASMRPSKPSPVAAGRRCDSCGGEITEAEIYFSTVKLRSTFGGKAICRSCQEAARATRSA